MHSKKPGSSQVQKFRRLARDLDADESEEAFNARSRDLAIKGDPDALEQLAERVGQTDPNWTRDGKPKFKLPD